MSVTRTGLLSAALGAAALALAGCVLANPAFDDAGVGATEASTGVSVGVTSAATSTAGTGGSSTTSGGSSGSTSVSTTNPTSATITTSTSSGSSTTEGAAASTADETTGEACQACSAQEVACDSNVDCSAIREIALDCGNDLKCISMMACDAGIEEVGAAVAQWGELLRCQVTQCGLALPNCVAEAQACYDNPACVGMNNCVTTECSCLKGEEIPACWATCSEAHMGGGEDWTAWVMCIGEG